MISERCSLGLSDDELSRWRDDDLSPARMALIREHTGACAACRERLAAFEEIGMGLRNLTPPPFDIERAMTGLREAHSPAATSAPTPAPASMPRRSRRIVTGAAGLAAVMILSLFAGYIFVNHGRPLPGGSVLTGTPVPLFTGELPLQTSVIAMSSPTDGWAFGSASDSRDSPVIALHYTGGRWRQVQTVVRGQVLALKMLSANDGWLAGDAVYHYDGHAWQKVAVPQQGADQFQQIAAFSPTALWISDVYGAQPTLLHYDGTTWSRQELPMAAGNYIVSSISMTSPDEGWAVASTYSGTDLTPLGVVLHYTGGVWSLTGVYPNRNLTTVSMASASDGWIGGGVSIPQGSNMVEVKPLLWRLSNGVWKDAPLPVPNGDDAKFTNFIQAIHVFSATEGWLIVATMPQHSLYRLQHGQWVEVPIPLDGLPGHAPSPYNANDFAFVSPTEFWTIGQYGVTHYLNGVWANVTS